ncbi:MAG: Fe-S cluster assembly protein SufD [Acidobacteria bacterium]|nr:MAG: Fe-S cluster assembly protein SufD [Acidobacteriota bacterium]
MSSVVADQNIYGAQFSALLDRLPGRGLVWLDRLRERAMDEFLELGFPTTRLESWKYTDVAPIRRIAFQPTADYPIPALPEALRLQVEAFPAPRLVFINGKIDRKLSRRAPLALLSLSEALADPEQAKVVQAHLGRYVSTAEHAFAAWNTAFFTDGAFILVPRGIAVEQPVNLVFVSLGTGKPWACFPRNLVIAREGSQVTFVETFIGPGLSAYLTNTVTEIIAEPGAMIDYYKIESESARSFHTATIQAHLDRDASLTSRSISFGGALVRNDLSVALDGEGSLCTLNGLFAAAGGQFVDNHTHVDHRKPHASSRELYKGVLAGNAEGVFNGTITAQQHSKNLLLSEHAQINTKPQFEIRANDVRCVHGATVGQIDEDAIFYLKSRGVGEGEARRILIRAFVAEILDDLRIPALRTLMERLFTGWVQSVTVGAVYEGVKKLTDTTEVPRMRIEN